MSRPRPQNRLKPERGQASISQASLSTTPYLWLYIQPTTVSRAAWGQRKCSTTSAIVRIEPGHSFVEAFFAQSYHLFDPFLWPDAVPGSLLLWSSQQPYKLVLSLCSLYRWVNWVPVCTGRKRLCLESSLGQWGLDRSSVHNTVSFTIAPGWGGWNGALCKHLLPHSLRAHCHAWPGAWHLWAWSQLQWDFASIRGWAGWACHSRLCEWMFDLP